MGFSYRVNSVWIEIKRIEFHGRHYSKIEQISSPTLSICAPSYFERHDIESAAWVIALSIEAVVHTMKIFGAPISKQRPTTALGDMIHRLLFK